MKKIQPLILLVLGVVAILSVLPTGYAENLTNGSLTNETLMNGTNSTNESLLLLSGEMGYLTDGIGAYYVLEDPLPPNSNDTELENKTLDNETLLTPLVGEVTQFETGYYVLLGDEGTINEYTISLGSIPRANAFLGEDIVLHQEMSVTNALSESRQFTINLWDHVDGLLQGAREVSISVGGELLSEQPIFFADVEANETITYEVEYVFSPLTVDTDCKQQTLQDLLPSGATVTSTTLPLDTIIQQRCSLLVNHQGVFLYADLVVPLDFVETDIATVYHVEGDQHIDVVNNTLILTEVTSLQ